MRCSSTLVERDPETGQVIQVLPGEVLPAWLADKVRVGNPKIIVEDSDANADDDTNLDGPGQPRGEDGSQVMQPGPSKNSKKSKDETPETE